MTLKLAREFQFTLLLSLKFGESKPIPALLFWLPFLAPGWGEEFEVLFLLNPSGLLYLMYTKQDMNKEKG